MKLTSITFVTDPMFELNSSPIKSTTAVPVTVTDPIFVDIDKPVRVTVSSARFPHSPAPRI
jgi:hypothetical protein